MCLKVLLSILCLFLALGFSVGSFPQCGGSGFSTRYFTPNDTYDTNRRSIFSTLGSKVSSQKTRYYNVSVGEGAGRIYALGMCIPGAEPKLCSDCIQSVANSLLQNCLNESNSYEWGSDKMLCIVSYSDISFFDILYHEPVLSICNSEDIGNTTEFVTGWEDFMKVMIEAASSSLYAAKVSPMLGFQRIYALMQCIPWLSSSDCRACLGRSIIKYKDMCNGRQGSNIRRPSCFFEWETYPYYDAFVDPMSPPPQGSQSMSPPGDPLYASKKSGKSFPLWGILVLAIIVIRLGLGAIGCGVVYCNKKRKKRKSYKPMELETDDVIPSSHPLQYDLRTIEAATYNFSSNNKLGEGGFGVVYKGTFPDGTEAAVKRLSLTSRQGFQEFKNEVIVVGKLQHNNLVKLLGYCMEGEEKILVYEFLSKKSLDLFLFDSIKKLELDWTIRYNIIEGIARGILYLHRDSRPKIIHRDLKASNILLDDDMKPKIADFGLAKILPMEQSRANTSKIAGTIGYMPPEYMNLGQFSMESDVYGFGVLVLEIISGETISNYYRIDNTDCNLGTYAWKLWRKGLALTLVDPTLGENYEIEQVTRCFHIALLCVQADPSKRPKLSDIISKLTTSKISQAVPCEPGFCDHS